MNVVNMPSRGRPIRDGDAAAAAARAVWMGSGRPPLPRSGSLGPGALGGRRILVTGGAGFIGSHIVDLLVECGCDEVVVTDELVRGRVGNLARAMESGRVRLVVADARDGALLADLLQGIDTVFHQTAPRTAHCANDGVATATFDLLKRCVQAGVRKVVVASPAPVCGLADAFPPAESRVPHDERTLDGAVEGFGEGLLRSFSETHGLSYVVLRHSDVYGPRMDAHGGLTDGLIRWMDRLEAGLAPIISGDGQRTLDMVHVEDVARANVLAAISPASDVALSVGSGEETSLLGLARLLARVMGRRSVQPELQPERSVGPVFRRPADTAAARESIGFEASIPLAAGLEELVTWWCTECDQAAPSHVVAV